MNAAIRMCGNPGADLNVLLVNGDMNPQECTGCAVLKARLGGDGAETSDGFMDNGFIVQANC